MAVSMNSYINGLIGFQNSGVRQMSQVRDFSSAQREARALLGASERNAGQVQRLQEDTSSFLREYSAGMRRIGDTASRLADGGIDAVLRDENGQVTAETVQNTVSAVRSMVDEFNGGVRILEDNAGRGSGVQSQLNRMTDDPVSAGRLVGITRNEDGTLALDEERLAEVLNTSGENQRRMFADIIGGRNSLAESIQEDARAGVEVSSRSLVDNDLARRQSVREEDSIQAYAQSLRGGGAYALSNSQAIGVFMNLVV